jgi:hypothetical protein
MFYFLLVSKIWTTKKAQAIPKINKVSLAPLPLIPSSLMGVS